MFGLAGNVYRLILPKKFRRQLSLHFKNDDINTLRKKILRYYSHLPANQISREQIEIISYLRKNPLSVFPYSFREKYDYRDVEVYFDEKLNLKYVITDGNRLYFKRNWSDYHIKGCYSFLQMEQDIESPHRYLTNDFFVGENDVVADVGAAEGTFALSIARKAGKVYIFESDKEWIEPLEATFAPWRGKVQIINKYVSDNDTGENITLDNFFKNAEAPNILKIDVEGAESELLNGCEKVLSSQKPLKVIICTYHKQNDGNIFSELLKNYGFEVSFSKRFMIFIRDLQMQPPYLRRGLIRASRNGNQAIRN